MRTSRWRYVAHSLAAASLCFFAIGCGDDTGTDDMAMDMGMRDMTMDLAMQLDGPPGLPSAAVIVADIVGKAYVDVPDGGEQLIPCKSATSCGIESFTHRLLTVNQFPMASSTPSDFSNLNVNAGTLTISGCVANHYDVAAGDLPTPDVDVGTITLGAVTSTISTTGWESMRFAASASAPAGQGGLFAIPLPNAATCTKDATTMAYGCVFKGAMDATPPIHAKGYSVTGAVFPALPRAAPATGVPNWASICMSFTGLTPTGTAADAAACAGATLTACPACFAACDQTGHANLCEQNMFYLTQTVDGGVSGTTIGVDVPGGAPYGAQSKSISIPPGPYITGIKVGTTAVTLTAHKLYELDGSFDATKDLSITYSCDPNDQNTTGAGCSGLSPFDLFYLVGATSTHTRGSFAAASAKFGTLNCLEQAKRTDATVTVPAAAWTAMLAGQTGGSITLNLLRTKGSLAQLGPNQLYAAGTGQFVFINLP